MRFSINQRVKVCQVPYQHKVQHNDTKPKIKKKEMEPKLQIAQQTVRCKFQRSRSVKPISRLKKRTTGRRKTKRMHELTSLANAAVGVRRSAGSIARRVSISDSDDGGKSLNVSSMHRLYGCWGLNMAACGNFDLFQNSSVGDPHSLKIL